MKVGYLRALPDDPEATAALRAALEQAGCDRIYEDAAATYRRGAPRVAWEQAQGYMRRGDTLVVPRLDRLGRGGADLLARVAELQAHGLQLVSLAEDLDTAAAPGQAFLWAIRVLRDCEPHWNRDRTAPARAARPRGRRGGRKPKATPAKLRRAGELMADKTLTIAEITHVVGLSRATLYRYLRPDGTPRKPLDTGA